MPFPLLAAIASLGGLLFGYDTGVISGALLFIARRFGLGPTAQGVVTASVLLGASLGAAGAGWAADRFGRRRTILAASAMFVAGSLLSALAAEPGTLAAGRMVVGAAVGVASMLTPLYLAELAPPARRGATVALNQFCLTVGIMLSYLADALFAGAAEGWRWMLGLGCLPGLALGAGMLALPESPGWRRERAAPWRALLAPALRRRLAAGLGLAVFQQVTGINTVIYYAPTLFRGAGFESDAAAILATAGIGAVNVAVTGAAMLLLDRVGRRPPLLWGLVGMAASLAVLCVGFLSEAHGVGGAGGGGAMPPWLMAGALAAYVGAFAIGLGPVFWLLIAEIFPRAVRGRAMGACALANWGANLAVALGFPDLLRATGAGPAFGLFLASTLACLAFAWFLAPETRGRSLEQIEADASHEHGAGAGHEHGAGDGHGAAGASW